MSESEYVRHLEAARKQVVQLRRYLAEGLGSPFKKASSEQRLTEQRMEQLVTIQRAIRAIDEAMDDERAIAQQAGPPGNNRRLNADGAGNEKTITRAT